MGGLNLAKGLLLTTSNNGGGGGGGGTNMIEQFSVGAGLSNGGNSFMTSQIPLLNNRIYFLDGTAIASSQYTVVGNVVTLTGGVVFNPSSVVIFDYQY